jgi:hypothetical protein
MSEPVRFGAHEVEHEEGLVRVRYHGPISGPDMTQIMRYFDELAARRGPVYVLIDSNDTPGPDESARRVMSTYGYHSVAGFARFQSGARTDPSSAMTKLLQNAARLLGKQTTQTAVFETEHEARSWLERLRESARPEASLTR